MESGVSIVGSLRKSFKGSKFLAIDSNSNSRDLVTKLGSSLFLENSYDDVSSLCMESTSKHYLRQSIIVMNMYGPYKGKHEF